MARSVSADALTAARNALAEYGSLRKAAAALGIPHTTLQSRIAMAERKLEREETGFDMPELPSTLPTAQALIERRKAEFERVDAAKQARRLIDVPVKLAGPVGVSWFGDPHLDDPGTDIALVERHVELVKRTPGLFAANIGDTGNHWVGRLARLYGEQSTSAAETWVLVEWLIQALPWLVIINGNHGCWNGAGDPLRWLIRQQPGAFDDNGVRLNLTFPNGKKIRVNARHDFRGHSMWNPAHGLAKAVQMGWRDHLLVAGHTHVTGYNVLKDPASGLISHALRIASYKTHDRYADTLGLPDSNITANAVTIFDPEATSERNLVTVFLDPEEGADFLTWKRGKYEQAKRANV
ncbi:hypothetical protein [Acidocella aminolytica]|uniref:Calcineurin-like phosphoesterase domain-containing protein n=1 Tax=Acidocella aminolytica 101 = DSM 11237 TaxID=1120923 RepID=A0A0D6PDJ5_9PROT|nr:hypothetical protein [Acidocella aminolytica]GAN79830.1 hypothetical protein Aam_030_063 [Acidocella aminolytica 101 = DSM 11237]GBQ31978.1 hypothetical protein AA11237_0029 [Acidocella aminolytica 101 = DSM 11237]SHF36090.1 hypothetical protein SAMN02746095_02971 [Acidocella aminolytica 101 = DSM 11237]